MMINRDKLIAEITSSIVARLKVELEASLKELLVGLKASRELRAAQLKDLADGVSKLKSTEDLLEPSSGTIPKIDTDLEFIHTESKSVRNFIRYSSILSADKENYRYTVRTRFSDRDEACFEVGFQEYNGGSSFLAYQEGKPFISRHDFLNVSGEFHGVRVRVNQQINYNNLNLLSDDEFRQYDDWKFTTDDDLNEFTSCLFKSLKVFSSLHVSPITSIGVELLRFDFARALFDRGKEIDTVVSCFSYDSNISNFCFTSYLLFGNGLIFMDAYELILELGYHLVLLFEVSNVLEFVKNRDKLDSSKLFDEMPQQGNMLYTGSILHVMKGSESSNACELVLQIHPTSRGNFNGNIGSPRLQLGYHVFKMLRVNMNKHERREVLHMMVMDPKYFTMRHWVSLTKTRIYACLLRSEYILFFFRIWSMGNGRSYDWIVIELLPKVPSFMGCGNNPWCSGWKEIILRVVVDGGESRINQWLGEMLREVGHSCTQLEVTVSKLTVMVTQICSLIETNGVACIDIEKTGSNNHTQYFA